MNHILTIVDLINLHFLVEYLQYNDVFDSGRKIFVDLLSGLQKVAPAAAAFCFAIGAYFWMFGGEGGKQTAKKWWIGTAVAIVVIFGANALVQWLQANGKF